MTTNDANLPNDRGLEPSEQEEARVVAMLLGDSADAEIAALENLLAARPDLCAFRDEMAALLPDVSAAHHHSDAMPEASVPGDEPWVLPEQRRALVMAALDSGTAERGASQPIAMALRGKHWPGHSQMRKNLQVAAAVVLFGSVAALFLGLWLKSDHPVGGAAPRVAAAQQPAKELTVKVAAAKSAEGKAKTAKPDDSARLPAPWGAGAMLASGESPEVVAGDGLVGADQLELMLPDVHRRANEREFADMVALRDAERSLAWQKQRLAENKPVTPRRAAKAERGPAAGSGNLVVGGAAPMEMPAAEHGARASVMAKPLAPAQPVRAGGDTDPSELRKPAEVDPPQPAKKSGLGAKTVTVQDAPVSSFGFDGSDASFWDVAAQLAAGEWPAPTALRPEQFVWAMTHAAPAPPLESSVRCVVDQVRSPLDPEWILVRVDVRALGYSAPAAPRVQVQWNPDRVESYRLCGSGSAMRPSEKSAAKPTLPAAGAIAAVALYHVKLVPQGSGDLGEVTVQLTAPGSAELEQYQWPLVYDPELGPLESSDVFMQMVTASGLLAEVLAMDPPAAAVKLRELKPVVESLVGERPGDQRVAALQTALENALRIAEKQQGQRPETAK